MRWVPTGAIGAPEGTVPAATRRSWAATVGGIIAVVAGLMMIVAIGLPYIHYTDSSITPTSPSIINPGFAPSNGFAIEPIGVAFIAIVTGVVLIAWMSRIPRAVASGVLIAFGVQTFLLFLGYAIFNVLSKDAQIVPGSFVGMFAGLLLVAGGVTCVVSLFARGPSPRV